MTRLLLALALPAVALAVAACGGGSSSETAATSSNSSSTSNQASGAAKLATSSRGKGVKEVTYNGHPLYFYAGDGGGGQTNGQGLDQFGAEWYVLSASGNKIDRGS
jgi:hypothetical protein